MSTEYDAIIVGAGPNGLAAAITLARAGCSVLLLEANSTVGGGIRSAALTLPGFVHDVCSAIHPLAVASPFFQTLPLNRFGLGWIEPEIPLAHPLDGGRAAPLLRGVNETANLLGNDAGAYRRLMGPLVRDWEKLTTEILQPMIHLPHSPLLLARFGLPALLPASWLAKVLFHEEPARAIFGGIAAHSFLPLEAIASSAFGLVLAMAGHAVGWPMPRGGSQMIANGLANYFRDLGGLIEVNQPVENLRELPSSRVYLLDISPWQFLRLAGDKLPSTYRRRLQRFHHAPGVCKIDYALRSAIPWEAEECRRAGTVHVGGTLDQIARAEREVAQGRAAEQPFVLVAQQSLFDATRAPNGQHTLWAYCHVPSRSNIDMSERIERQIERFAPGFRDCILARHISRTTDLERSNGNLIGGDINGGAANLWQLIARPVLSRKPYRTPLGGVYLCSASTPPGGGVHGMCGYHAARTALSDLKIPYPVDS